MPGDARAIPLRGRPLRGPASGRRLRDRIAPALAGASYAQWAGAICLLAILIGSALVVVAAADRPSQLAPTSHAGLFPRWMAGPLGGLWPDLTRNTTALRWLFSGAVVVMYVAYLFALVYAPALRARLVVGAIVIVHAVLLLSPPLPLTDVFNYVNYGRMEVVHNLNPYTTIPILEPHGDPSYALSNWHQLLSPYGPLFTLLTFAVVPLGVAASFWALKLLLAAASLATLALVWRCAQLLGRDPLKAIVLVGLNPIVLMWGLGGDHNDALIMLCIVLGLYLLLRGREGSGEPAGAERRWLGRLSPADVAAGGAFVAAAAIKASAAVLIPVVLASLLRSRRRLGQVVLGMALVGALVGAASVIAFGLHVPDLNTQSRLVTSESVPNLIGLALGTGGETETLRAVLSGVLAVSLLLCCIHAWRRQSPLSAAGWASVALLVTLSWVLPWYVVWVLPLAALAGSRSLRVASAVLGAYLIIAWAPASSLVWDEIGFHPEKTSLGRLHQRYVRELLN
jgi:Glycosyltransferase family 87